MEGRLEGGLYETAVVQGPGSTPALAVLGRRKELGVRERRQRAFAQVAAMP